MYLAPGHPAELKTWDNARTLSGSERNFKQWQPNDNQTSLQYPLFPFNCPSLVPPTPLHWGRQTRKFQRPFWGESKYGRFLRTSPNRTPKRLGIIWSFGGVLPFPEAIHIYGGSPQGVKKSKYLPGLGHSGLVGLGEVVVGTRQLNGLSRNH